MESLPSIGQTFHHRYELREVLGRGGFAAVYLADDVTVGRRVALKVLDPGPEGYSQPLVSRFLREARVIATLSHPNTITMFDFGRSDEGLLFMVFELVRGFDLAKVLRMRGALGVPTTVHILRQLLGALSEAHAEGVVHRDIKPANILVYDYQNDPNRVKLIDFGIAKPAPTAGDSASLTKTGAVVGTAKYMAPEQVVGEEVSPASDIYALGLVAFEMLTGAPVIDADNTVDKMRAQLSEEPLRLPSNLSLPMELRAVLERMTARNPRARYRDASECLAALEGLMAPRPRPKAFVEPSAPSVSATAPPDVATSMRTIAVALVGVGLGAALILTLLTRLSEDDADRHRSEPALPTVQPQRTSPERPTVPELPVALVDDEQVRDDPVELTVVIEEDGCGIEADHGVREFFTHFEGQQRRWVIYVPKGYRRTVRHPVVLLFHNSFNTPSFEIENRGFRPIADENGFVIIAPGTDIDFNSWADQRWLITFVRRVMDEANDRFCLDRTRIFGVGHGAGGRAVESLTCGLPMSAIAGSGYRPGIDIQPCEPMGPTPYINFAADNDPYNPLEGGISCTGYPVVAYETVLERWRNHNHCDATSESRYAKQKDATCTRWNCDAPFVSCMVRGGHEWYGKPDGLMPLCEVRPSKYDYASAVWKFLDENGRAIPSGSW